MARPLLILFGSVVLGAARLTGAAQPLPLSIELELVHVLPQYADDSSVDAAREPERTRVECVVEFEDASEIFGVELFVDGESFPLQQDGDGFAGVFDDVSSSVDPRSDFEVVIDPETGGNRSIAIDAGNAIEPDPPEIRFPMDGQDEISGSGLDTIWDGSADDARIDLFELSNAPEDALVSLRTGGFEEDLSPHVSNNEAYELWVGLTEIDLDETDEGVEVSVRLTESRSVRFATGPNPREQITDYQQDDKVDFAWAGRVLRRYGQVHSVTQVEGLAVLSGPAIDEAETARIQGLDDGRVLGSFHPLTSGTSSNVYLQDLSNLQTGQSILFLVEFDSGAVGSEVRQAGDPLLVFPDIQTPPTNQAGVTSDVDVTWTFPSDPARFLVRVMGAGVGYERNLLVAGTDRSALVQGLPPGADFLLEVSAFTEYGRGSSTAITLSTATSGDVDGDGEANGLDLFGFAASWLKLIRPMPNGTPYPFNRLDADGDEQITVRDLLAR